MRGLFGDDSGDDTEWMSAERQGTVVAVADGGAHRSERAAAAERVGEGPGEQPKSLGDWSATLSFLAGNTSALPSVAVAAAPAASVREVPGGDHGDNRHQRDGARDALLWGGRMRE